MNKSWTKYGGGRGGNEAIVNDKEWYCQKCATQKTPNDIVFNTYERGMYLRICEKCARLDNSP